MIKVKQVLKLVLLLSIHKYLLPV